MIPLTIYSTMGNWYITLQYRIEISLDWFSLCRRLLAGCCFFYDEAVDRRSDLQYALDDLRIRRRPHCSSHFLNYCTYTIHILLFRRLLSLHTCCCLPWCEVQIFTGTPPVEQVQSARDEHSQGHSHTQS
jgi:hypothetical protein